MSWKFTLDAKLWKLQHELNDPLNKPLNEQSGLIFFKNDWFDLGVQGTLKSLL